LAAAPVAVAEPGEFGLTVAEAVVRLVARLLGLEPGR
jgi:hypothetical protein